MMVLAYILLTVIFIELILGLIVLFVIVNQHKSLRLQLCYTYLFCRQEFYAYQRVKKEGFIYYDNFREWFESPTYGKGNEIVKLDNCIGVYIEGKLIIPNFFNKMVESLLK